MLLRDEEWAKWSDSEIAERCSVDHKTVAAVRCSMAPHLGTSQVTNATRTVRTKHGTTTEMNVANIWRKPKPEPVTPTAPAAAPDRG